jgi:hypothetical protein
MVHICCMTAMPDVSFLEEYFLQSSIHKAFSEFRIFMTTDLHCNQNWLKIEPASAGSPGMGVRGVELFKKTRDGLYFVVYDRSQTSMSYGSRLCTNVDLGKYDSVGYTQDEHGGELQE